MMRSATDARECPLSQRKSSYITSESMRDHLSIGETKRLATEANAGDVQEILSPSASRPLGAKKTISKLKQERVYEISTNDMPSLRKVRLNVKKFL